MRAALAPSRFGGQQANFAAALTDPGRPVPSGLVGPNGRPSTTRFNVYRNNMVGGLTRVLQEAFPATSRIVGTPFFDAMARVYIGGELPRSPMLFDYGGNFPKFIDGFEPAAGLPYLGDIARVERAWIEAYHAPEARSIGPSAFARVAPARLPGLRAALHPSLRLVRSTFPALRIWQVNVDGAPPPSVDLEEGGEDVLIVRPSASVELHILPPGGAVFLQALREARPILEATEAAMAADQRFVLSRNLSELMGAGAFIGIDLKARPQSLSPSPPAA